MGTLGTSERGWRRWFRRERHRTMTVSGTGPIALHEGSVAAVDGGSGPGPLQSQNRIPATRESQSFRGENESGSGSGGSIFECRILPQFFWPTLQRPWVQAASVG